MRAAVLSLALLFAGPALAQEAPPSAAELALAAQVVDAAGGVEAAKAGMAALGPAMLAGYADQGLTPEMGEVLIEELGKGFDRHKEEFLAASAAVYAKHFTEAELRDLLAFMRSPSGKVYVGKLGPLMIDSGAVGEAMAEKMMPSVMQRFMMRVAPKPPRT